MLHFGLRPFMPDSSPANVVAIFMAHLPHALGEAARDLQTEIEPELDQILARASAAPWAPEMEDEEVLAYVAQRVPEQGELPASLRRLHVEDLMLARACAMGDPVALAQVEEEHFGVIDAALSRMPDAAAQVPEIKQQIRQQLFVSEGDQAAKIAQYSGRGELRSWLRVVAIRCAINLLQRHGREVELKDEVLTQFASPGENQELDYLKRRYRAEFKQCFEGALASLTSRDRNILCYHYLERLNIDQIGEIYKVHRTTAARWLARIRGDLLERTRRSLMEKLRIEKTEFESIMRLIESHLEASIEKVLRD